MAQIITGTESTENLSSQLHALSKFYAAFNNKNIAGLRENWSHMQAIVAYNPGGGIRRSWEELERIYEGIFSAPFDVQAAFSDYTIADFGTLFCAYGKETVTITANGEPTTIDVRITRIYVLEGDTYKQVHLHGSIDDPELLKRYQEITRP